MTVKSLTTGEIAKFCDVNLRTVIRWLDAGKLKGYKLPGRGNNRVTEEDFVTFLQQNNMPIPTDFQNKIPQQKQHPKVLIVDDDAAMAASIKRVLHPLNLDCEIATDGFKAGTILHKQMPELMTLDLSMPGLDGFEVLEFARQQEEYANVKILVISALNQKSLDRAKSMGADACLSKPFRNDELQQLVRNLLGIKSSE